jgi:hypothetical protein
MRAWFPMKAPSPNETKTLLSPDRLPDPWLMDSEYLLGRLGQVREIILRIPLNLATYAPTNLAIEAVWQLEGDLRFMLKLHRERQVEFRTKAVKPAAAIPTDP